MKFVVVYVYVAAVGFVHFRSRVRLRFGRQLSEHSGLFAPYNTLMYLFSAVPTRPILDVERFGELRPLRDNWKVLREEAVALFDAGEIRRSDRHDDLIFLAFHKRGWKRFYLKWYDSPMRSARALCPRSVALVESIPGLNAAAFTLLPPGKTLGKHRDPFAGSLRYHLGLVTPNSDACAIWVDGEKYYWRDGEDVVFDETYVHWAANKSDVERIILFADVTRPLRTPVMRGLNRVARRVLQITRSGNVPSDGLGVLNRVTPHIYRYKYFMLGLKEGNRKLYYTVKHALVLVLVYRVFVHGWIT